MSEHLFPTWTKLEHINDETYITTIAGYHIVVSRTGTKWRYSCDFVGLYDRPLPGLMICLDDIKKAALEKVLERMNIRIRSAQNFLQSYEQIEEEVRT